MSELLVIANVMGTSSRNTLLAVINVLLVEFPMKIAVPLTVSEPTPELMTILPLPAPPPRVRVLAVNVRFEVVLPVLKKVELTVVRSTLIVEVLRVTDPTVRFEVSVADAALMLLT